MCFKITHKHLVRKYMQNTVSSKDIAKHLNQIMNFRVEALYLFLYTISPLISWPIQPFKNVLSRRGHKLVTKTHSGNRLPY